jgi:hypothetical protein
MPLGLQLLKTMICSFAKQDIEDKKKQQGIALTFCPKCAIYNIMD